ncbi:glycosyltransferase family 4 protein [Calothrix sp. UHCC 0171]|uniref:glycosyltransferase family 4 protein n=1 Tax=Calothrix sp. UHCC 0171 TaxID=3110245 RepID=UPI002B21C1F1|nr:glycosyltransferase family 4 protein [Calothrix sp. UHCC 0171]MEA5569584.1 glycosyltransferase family 4 protein [Calothrix sp. UHCC 0171]
MRGEVWVNGSNKNYLVKPASILCVGLGWFPKTPGGLERYIYDLTHKLAANHDYIELCGVDLPEGETDLSIKLTNLAAADESILQRMRSCRINFRKTRGEKPDAINLHFALYSFPILDLLPKKVPITFNFHGPWVSESGEETKESKISFWLKKWLIEQQTYNRCDRFIVLSKAFGNILHQEYQIPWEKIYVIPGGVDIDKFQPNLSPQQARSQLGWQQNRQIIFTSRRLVHRVGIDKLLNAIAQIKRRVPDVWVAIAGRGPIQAALQQQASELGLDDHVKFIGYLAEADLPVAYQAADFSIMPSQSFEGFGLAVVESLACGTPVICTPIGGMPEILQPFSPNLITASAHENAIAETLEQVLLGKIAIPSRSQCRDYATANFDWTKIAQQVRQVLLA